ncbi:unnamed protein product [Leptosia nina]|uniref:DALR anticodon binding domain-containing protein n=1 Tax=Leptosia nina TaxID=320188 RepID=A0AAV1K2V9_9NEOP
MEDALEIFTTNICSFLSVKKQVTGLLVKKHSNNLHVLGDYSFPNTVKSWSEFLDSEVLQKEKDNLLQCIEKDTESLLLTSKSWNIPIQHASEVKDRVHLYMERSFAIRKGLSQSFTNNKHIIDSITAESFCNVKLDTNDETCLTSLRLNYTAHVIKNLYVIDTKCSKSKPRLFISTRSSSQCDDHKLILCGAVLNIKTGVKETEIKTTDFIRIRQEELTLIAQHKYGVRVSSDTKWKEFIAYLGQSAVAFELLQIRPSSCVKVQFDASSGSSKGAAFILYNCARLETIIKTFNDKVNEGIYPHLPKFEDIDLTLLTHEDEWSLVFNYILGLPTLLKNCVEITEEKCEFRPHLICSFLSSMVRIVSQYYRKVRILIEPRKHLLPVIFARIYLLTCLNDTLKTCLRILNIKSVSQMY